MDKISRAEAKSLGLNKYFTGNACPSGHVAQRYVQSGACCDCLSVAPAPVAPDILASVAAYRENEQRRTHALGELLEMKLWAHADDIVEIRETAVACCLGVFPCLNRDDVKCTYGPTATKGDLGHYRVRVPFEYVTFMRSLAAVHVDRRSAAKSDAELRRTRDVLDDIFRNIGKPAML